MTETAEELSGSQQTGSSKPKGFPLPPDVAISKVWARMAYFAAEEKDEKSTEPDKKCPEGHRVLSESEIKELMDWAGDDEERQAYITSAASAMDGSLRSLCIVYKGRELNFDENKKLREAYLDSVEDSIKLEETLKGSLKTLPIPIIGTVGGVSASSYLGLSGIALVGFGAFLAIALYLVSLGAVIRRRKGKEKHYVIQDFERNLYFDDYLKRVESILLALHRRLQQIHESVFGATRPGPKGEETVRGLLIGVKPNYCEYVNRHMRDKKKIKFIARDLWATCESGHRKESCRFYPKTSKPPLTK